MSKSPIISDFKITGGYILTRPTAEDIEHLEHLVVKGDQEWRYKSAKLQKRRWRKLIKHGR